MLSDNLYRLLVRDRIRRAGNYGEHGKLFEEEELLVYGSKPETLVSFETRETESKRENRD